MTPSSTRVGFREVLRVREFRYLFIADIQSQLGDQLARVALSVLVFSRTGSTLLTAAVFALTFLPAVLAGWVLAISPMSCRVGRFWSAVMACALFCWH